MDCSWCDEDVLVVGGFFVEIDSYAIAILSYANSTRGNSMGLILDARGSLCFGSIAYGKRRQLLGIRTQTLPLLSSEDTVQIQGTQSQKLCRRSWTRQIRSMMITKIESSTDVCPCKKRCHC